MIRYPVFKAQLLVEILPGEGVLLLSEDTTRALHGRLYEHLAPLLDGAHSVPQLVAALAPQFDGTHVHYALALLEKNGHITEAEPTMAPAEAAFWDGIGLVRGTVSQALQQKCVSLHAVGNVSVAPLREALERLGVQIGIERADLAVVLTDDYQRRELADVDTSMRAAGRAWLVARPGGHEPWLGPLYAPGDAACHRCLAHYLARNRVVHRFIAERRGQVDPPITGKAALPATLAMAAELLAIEIIKFLSGGVSVLRHEVLSIDTRNWTTLHHPLRHNPCCTACGMAASSGPRPLMLMPRPMACLQDGGYRSVPPEQIFEKYRHLISPITGVVTKLRRVHEDGDIAHVYVAGHNGAFRMGSLDFLKRSLRAASSGKGMSDMQAKVSALCEAIERYSCERRGDEVVITDSYLEMQRHYGDDAIHPNQVMLYSERQLAERKAWNDRKSMFNWVPEPLDATLPIDWTPVWSLTHQRRRYLPTQLVYCGSPASTVCDAFYAVGCSNGNASGNNLEEAVLQGFLELVERDAIALWWYNRLRKPGASMRDVELAYPKALADHYASIGREAWVLDLTSDLGIPVFAALSRRLHATQEQILFGFGCHLDARIALQRACAEMNQMLGLAQDGRGGNHPGLEDEETVAWLTTATLDNQTYLAPAAGVPMKRPDDFPIRHSGDLLQDITHCRRIVEQRGMEVLVLDQTRADTGLPAVKVIVPGLRHFWARYGSGRLYDVPVAMGWLPEARTEDELNPIPMFM